MKPAKFDYFAPASLEEALELLGQHGPDAKVLAGGQSLMPMMNLRLVRPAVVVDVNRIDGLSGISAADGTITVGALTRQRDLGRSDVIRGAFPAMTEAISHIGHFQIRNRGTIGGSLAHSDPAAEIPALCLALDAEITAASSSGERTIAASDFALGPLTTALEPQEILTQVRLPLLDGHGEWRWGFREVCRRDGDFALVGAVTLLRIDEEGVCRSARITMFGVGDGPARMADAEASLVGRYVDVDARAEAAALVSAAVDPGSDIHASAEYRKEVSAVMARRALEDACAG
jgi:CO/xanthine dehydrogenase FAD-binding subunit